MTRPKYLVELFSGSSGLPSSQLEKWLNEQAENDYAFKQMVANAKQVVIVMEDLRA